MGLRQLLVLNRVNLNFSVLSTPLWGAENDGNVLKRDEEKRRTQIIPAPVAQWLAHRTVGRKVWGSNPIRVMWDFSAVAGSYPELGVLWAQWEGWNHTAELHPLNGCVFEGVALIT